MPVTAADDDASAQEMPARRARNPAVRPRLTALLLSGIALLETRLAADGLTDANAKLLTELCRAEEMRMRSQRTRTGKAREAKTDATKDIRDDPAWIRAEFARRLERLARGRPPVGDQAHGDGQGVAADAGGVERMGKG